MSAPSEFSFPLVFAGFESFSQLVAKSPHFDLEPVINDALQYFQILREKTGDEKPPRDLRFTVANDEGYFHFIDDEPGDNHALIGSASFLADHDQLKRAAEKRKIDTPEEMFTRTFILYEKIIIARMDGYHPALLDKQGGLTKIVLPGKSGQRQPNPGLPPPILQ